VTEAALLGAIAGSVGVAGAVGLVENGMGRFMEENSGGAFPFFRISSTTAVGALALACLLGMCAAFVPALRMGRLSVVQALRRVE
jgi:putative ABC transport system permease protein